MPDSLSRDIARLRANVDQRFASLVEMFTTDAAAVSDILGENARWHLFAAIRVLLAEPTDTFRKSLGEAPDAVVVMVQRLAYAALGEVFIQAGEAQDDE